MHRVRPYADPRDREVAGFCAAALAFGRVASVLQSIEALFRIMGPRPRLRAAVRPGREAPGVRGLVHRWIRGVDRGARLVLRQMLEQAGSIEAFFLDGDSPVGT